jgi:hypothetical protein
MGKVSSTVAVNIAAQAVGLKIWDGVNYLAIPQAGDAVGRGILIYGSDYSAAPGPYARVVKVDSSGRLSCVLG